MNPLVLAALPAFLGSLFLMNRGAAAPSQVIQQVVAFGICGFLCAVLSRKPVVVTEKSRNWLLAASVLALLAPLVLMSGDGPRRWIGLGGFRLYIASVILPAALFLLARTFGAAKSRPLWPLTILVTTAAALAAQPDASQATAFALACLAFLLRSPLPLLARAAGFVALSGAVAIAWSRPDPLQPVPYVEGVLALAGASGPFALAFALLALALPLVVLLRRSRASGNPSGPVAVALYYAAIGFFAYRQLTPMPLLGFGVGPILGYFGMATLVAWNQESETASVAGNAKTGVDRV